MGFTAEKWLDSFFGCSGEIKLDEWNGKKDQKKKHKLPTRDFSICSRAY